EDLTAPGAMQETTFDQFVQRSCRSAAFAEFLIGALEPHVIAIAVGSQKLFFDEDPGSRGLPGKASRIIVFENLLAALLDKIGGDLREASCNALAVEFAAEKAQQRRLDIELEQSPLPGANRLFLAPSGRGDEADNLLADFG